jgi:thioesterase III
MIHTIFIKVRGYHLDVFGHVNNARYLEFLEEARWAFFEAGAGLTALMERNISFVVVNININFKRPALLGHRLKIDTTIQKINHRSGVIRQVIRLDGTDTVIADADVTFVLYDNNAGAAAPLKGELADFLAPLMASII